MVGRSRASCARNWRVRVTDPVAPDLLLDVTVEEGAGALENDGAFAERVLQAAVAASMGDLPPGVGAVYVSLLLTENAHMAAINHEHRGIEGTTDVLSFPQHADPRTVAPVEGIPMVLGDIVISLPRLRDQARDYGHTREREYGFLLVHGYLHLLGYDHETATDAAAMEQRQEAVLGVIGLSRDVPA